jgi:hypothetical protein
MFFFYEIGNVPWSRMLFLHLSYSDKIALKHQNFTLLTIVNIILYFLTSKRPCDITRSSNLCLSTREAVHHYDIWELADVWINNWIYIKRRFMWQINAIEIIGKIYASDKVQREKKKWTNKNRKFKLKRKLAKIYSLVIFSG